MDNIRIITTADGSHSLINTLLDETYHSSHGARQESLHVFIANGLDYFIAHNPQRDVTVLEVGFGTGLNALLTLQRARTCATTIRYTGVELYPLPEEVWRALNYPQWQEREGDFFLLHELSWETVHEVAQNFFFRKERAAIQDYLRSPVQADVIYFDAFAPARQPDIWSVEVLSQVVDAMQTGGVFVTYCAQGQLRRTLKSLGLHVESLQGAPGKKEMTRAIKK